MPFLKNSHCSKESSGVQTFLEGKERVRTLFLHETKAGYKETQL